MIRPKWCIVQQVGEEKALFDEFGNCTNLKLLSEELGNVPLGDGVISIVQTIKVKDLSMPTGSLSTAYLGDWVPGGFTQGGISEGIIFQNRYDSDNVEIKSHTARVSVEDMKNRVGMETHTRIMDK